MSRAWKWILGILGVLIIVAVVAGGAWLWANRGARFAAVRPYTAQPNSPTAPFGPNGQYFQNGPRGFGNDGHYPYGFRGPMMGNRFMRFGPFGMGIFFLGGLLRLIVPLGLLVLVAILFYQFGKRAGLSSAARREPAPVTSAPSNQNPPSAA